MHSHTLNRRDLFCRALLAAIACGWACSTPAADAPAAGAKSPYEQRKNVVFGEVDGIGLVMDVFTPTGAKNGIAMVDIASGAYHSDRGKIEDHRRAKVYDIFCGKGYTVFAIRPGSISKFSIPEMVKNLRTGIHWVRDHAGDFGIDPNNMGITGGSAGGHLACLTVVSTEPDQSGHLDQPFTAVGVFFPPTDFVGMGNIAEQVKNERWVQRMRSMASANRDSAGPVDVAVVTEMLRKISPALLVDRKQPPFLLIHGDADPVVKLQQSEIMVAALKKAGGSAELIVKPGGSHPWPTIAEEVKVMADWFDKQLKPRQ